MSSADRSYEARYRRRVGKSLIQYHAENPGAKLQGPTGVTPASVITTLRSAAGPLRVDGAIVDSCCQKPCIFLPVTIPGNFPPDGGSTRAFVIACIDPRYASALEEYLVSILNGATYDLFILAGASLGGNLTGNGFPVCGPSGNTNGKCTIVSNDWQSPLLDHIQVAISLHDVTQLVIVDHLDCGAYKACGCAGSTDANPNLHETQYDKLSSFILNSSFYANGDVDPAPKTLGSVIFTDGVSGLYFDTPTPGDTTTTLRNYSGGSLFTGNFPNTSGAQVLVLGCIDPRFSAVLSDFLVNYKDVQFIYDPFILAGASLGANQSYKNRENGGFPNVRGNDPATTNYPNNLLANNGGGIGYLGRGWGPTFFDHVSVALGLHGIIEVWAFDHLDCGAYKFIKFGNPGDPDVEFAPHTEELVRLQNNISAVHPELNFKGFIIDLDGNITKVVDVCAP
jgi:hypothetical protein